MSELQALSCSTSRYFTGDTSALTALYHNGGYLAQVCYVVQLSPRLTRLALHGLPMYCMDDINLLARTLTGLTQLQELYVSLHSTVDVLDHTVPTIFFSLPQSIRTLNLNLYRQYNDPATFDRGVRTTQGLVPRRKEPLLQLTHWQVQTDKVFIDDTLRSMIQQCPALVEMEIPKIRLAPEIIRPGLAQFIVNHCPSLHTLSGGDVTQGQEEQMAMAIMDAMPQDTLRALAFKEFIDRSGELGEAIEQHAASLTTIVIGYAELTEETILTILINCEALEVFDIETEGGCYSDGEIHLVNLVAVPWASTRLRTLKLIVNIGDTGILSSPLYLRDAPVLLSDEEQYQLSLLEILYEQIGMLTELEHLSLIISVPDDHLEDDEDLISWDRYVFPGMLTLDGDKTKGLPGYLGLLSGLKKLKILEGFVNVSTKETKATMGWREVEWIRKNWPRLKRAEFFEAWSEIRPCFAWLEEQMPGLDMRSRPTGRFFNMPELVVMITSFLPSKDKLTLMQTNSDLYAIVAPLFYRDLKVIISSETCTLSSLTRYGQDVRVLRTDLTFIRPYYSGVLAHMNNTSSGNSTSDDDIDPRKPTWLPAPNAFLIDPTVPLAMMTCLTSLALKMNYHEVGSGKKVRASWYETVTSYNRQVCWIVSHCRHLDVLDLDGIVFWDEQDFSRFGTGLAGSSRLSYLELKVLVTTEFVHQIPLAVFFKCPPSIEHLQLTLDSEYFVAVVGQLVTRDGLPRDPRQGPLPKLVYFGITSDSPYANGAFSKIFPHCPALESIHVPFLFDDNAGVQLISEAIKEHCPALCGISQDYREEKEGDFTMFHAIVDNARRDSLENIHLAQANELEWPLLEVFQRHSRLRNYQLDLEDAVAIPWGRTRIKFLELVINLGGDLEGDDNGDLCWELGRQAGNEDCLPTHGDAMLLKTFYSRELPIVLTESEQERMRLLQKLYRQLGSLSLLETLEIFVATIPDRGVDYCCYSFPGMLVLEDKDKGRPGFLGLFSGLKNLKELVGSVSAYTRETRLALGQAEMEWMVKQWPKLERIELEPPGHPKFKEQGDCGSRFDDGRLHWLKSKRPKLKVQCR
ncbi:hypothetical protein BGX30_004360 [Mortierella sp. GBA39]|nr:hypothetical protein BGX30_004360 [Mortierella sp. GBA39]